MIINKKYHGLKKHYLINKAGRACRISKNLECFCMGFFYVNGKKVQCGNTCFDFFCNPCKQLSKLIKYYLNEEQIRILQIKDKSNFNKIYNN